MGALGEYRKVRLAARILDGCSILRGTLRHKRPNL